MLSYTVSEQNCCSSHWRHLCAIVAQHALICKLLDKRVQRRRRCGSRQRWRWLFTTSLASAVAQATSIIAHKFRCLRILSAQIQEFIIAKTFGLEESTTARVPIKDNESSRILCQCDWVFIWLWQQS